MSKAKELAKKCGLHTNDYFVWSPGSQSVSVEHLELVVHAARAEALREAAKSIESVDPFSFSIELLRSKAKIEENQ